MSEDNRREFTRVEVEVPVKIAGEDGAVCAATLVDIGMKGLLVQCPPASDIEDPCFLTINANGSGTIHARGSIIRTVEGRMAIQFTHVEEDDYESLYLLIAKNARDSEEVRNEVTTYKGLSPYISNWSRLSQVARRHQPF